MKLLFSARDPAAARAIGNIVDSACSDPRFSVKVIASAPACNILAGLPCELLSLSGKVAANSALIESTIHRILTKFNPDAVISGASGPDAGVDEYLVKQAKQTGRIRSYVIQDFWGDVNLTLNAPPDCYLVSDYLAATITQKRVNSEAYVVGSVKHSHYGSLDVERLRTQGRLAAGVTGNETLIGYFGMPLGCLDGYWRTLESFLMSIEDTSASLIYRPHPKEDKQMRMRTCKILSEYDGFMVDQSDCVEETLAACDLVLSCYSSCGIDSELLGRNFKQDPRLSVFLLYDSEVFDYYREYTKLEDLPVSLQKRSLTIKDQTILRHELETYLQVESRLDFLSSGQCSPTAGGSVIRVLDKVYQDYMTL